MKKLMPNGHWDPLAFVDCCEEAASGKNSDSLVDVLRELQRIETEALLGWFCK